MLSFPFRLCPLRTGLRLLFRQDAKLNQVLDYPSEHIWLKNFLFLTAYKMLELRLKSFPVFAFVLVFEHAQV